MPCIYMYVYMEWTAACTYYYLHGLWPQGSVTCWSVIVVVHLHDTDHVVHTKEHTTADSTGYAWLGLISAVQHVHVHVSLPPTPPLCPPTLPPSPFPTMHPPLLCPQVTSLEGILGKYKEGLRLAKDKIVHLQQEKVIIKTLLVCRQLIVHLNLEFYF